VIAKCLHGYKSTFVSSMKIPTARKSTTGSQQGPKARKRQVECKLTESLEWWKTNKLSAALLQISPMAIRKKALLELILPRNRLVVEGNGRVLGPKQQTTGAGIV
jgi:hypothetical protein